MPVSNKPVKVKTFYGKCREMDSNSLRALLKEKYSLALKRNNDTYAFSGEFDSNQTKFEKMSNQMEVCVFCPNAYVVPSLAICRMMVDGFTDMISDSLDMLQEQLMDDPECSMTPLEMLTLSEKYSFESYGTSGPILDKLSRELCASSGVSSGEQPATVTVKPTNTTKIYTAKMLYDFL